MVSSIRWYQSARRAAFTLRFTSMSQTEREVLVQHTAVLFRRLSQFRTDPYAEPDRRLLRSRSFVLARRELVFRTGAAYELAQFASNLAASPSQNAAPHHGFRLPEKASCAPRRARDTGRARHDRSPDIQSAVHSESAAKA